MWIRRLWLGCYKYTRYSTSGYDFSVNGTPVLWKSKRQTLVTLSSAEAEYVTMSSCSRYLAFIRNLFRNFFHHMPWSENIVFETAVVDLDSTAAIELAYSYDNSSHTSYISLNNYHLLELIDKVIIEMQKISGRDNSRDLFTKWLRKNKRCRLRSLFKLH